MSASMGRFLGIAVDNYRAHPRLDHPARDVMALRELLEPMLAGQVEVDPTEDRVRAVLNDLRDGLPDGGALVVMWSGHGIRGIEGFGPLRLLAADSGTDGDDGFGVAEMMGKCAKSGASQVLLVLDTCYSGAAVMAATAAGAAVQRYLPPDSEHVWVGVLTSCLSDDTARDGLFGARLHTLLAEGPRSPHSRRRWSVHNRFLRGDDLCDALVKEWDHDEQRPDFQSRGSAWWMLPNPLHDRDAPEEVVEHLLRAARSGGDAIRSWFTGRVAEVDRVVDWVTSGEPGVHVVTGSPGTGKSAIVGRVVSLSNRVERSRLLTDGTPPSHRDPGAGSVTGHAHARASTVDLLAESLDAAVVRAGVLAANDEGRRNPAELVGALQRIRDAGQNLPVLVVDGLDEAREHAFTIARDLLLRLGAVAAVIVSTRDVPEPSNDSASLVSTLSPVDVIDLDTPAARESGRAAVHGYVVNRLGAADPAMDAELVAEVIDSGAQRSFLLARLVTDQLLQGPVNTSRPGWQRNVSRSIETAFESDLARAEPSRHDADGLSGSVLVRTMLTALTWTGGAGFPEDEWLTAATTLAGTTIGRDDISWVLDELGRYVVQDGEAGVAVYRIAHQALADHLRKPHVPSFDEPFDPAARRIAEALLSRYEALLDAGMFVDQPVYLSRYIWHHAALAGPSTFVSLRALADREPALLPHVAFASDFVAVVLSDVDRKDEALAHGEDAVALYRSLVEDDPATYQSYLADALGNLGVWLSDLGQWDEALARTEEAVALGRRLVAADSAAYLPGLAYSLINLAGRLSDVGRLQEALAFSEESVVLLRELVTTNPNAYLPSVAMALVNLSLHLELLGRRQEALPIAEEAVAHYRDLTEAGLTEHLPQLVHALVHLGGQLSELGRGDEALIHIARAVDILRDLVEASPMAHRSGLAKALISLGNQLSELGRPDEALTHTTHALTIIRGLAEAEQAGVEPDLAVALGNVSSQLSVMGRHQEALAPAEEAIAIWRKLAQSNPALYLSHVAGSLAGLSDRLAELGRTDEGLAPIEESVGIRRELAATNPAAYQLDLANVLAGYSIQLSEMDRQEESLAPAKEAVAILRELAKVNPTAYLPHLALALNTLGNRLSQLDRPSEALTNLEEATRLYRSLVTANPTVYLPALAVALNNLARPLTDHGRLAEALAVIEKSARIRRDLAKSGTTAALSDLASAQVNLGIQLMRANRHDKAVAPTAEAVKLYRSLAETEPAAFGADLAQALYNLSARLSAVDRREDALAAIDEAVDRYQALAGANPTSYLRLLSATLNDRDVQLAEVGLGHTAENRWRETVSNLDAESRAILLVLRAQRSAHPDITWLAEAVELAPDNRDLMATAHHVARSLYRDQTETAATAWQLHTGTPLPPWLTVDDELLALAGEWAQTETYEAERDFLAAHPVLLQDIADIAVEEAVLPMSPDAADQLVSTREAAQQLGVADAYRPLVAGSLAHELMHADTARRRQLVAERRAELLDPMVREALEKAPEQDGLVNVLALGLLTVADQAPHALPAVLDAIDTPATFGDLFQRCDPSILEPVTHVAMGAAEDVSQIAIGLLWLGVAHAEAGDTDAATKAVTDAFRVTPGQRTEWITLLATHGARRPAMLTLVPVLVALTPEEAS